MVPIPDPASPETVRINFKKSMEYGKDKEGYQQDFMKTGANHPTPDIQIFCVFKLTNNFRKKIILD